jgi:hypothetical protein
LHLIGDNEQGEFEILANLSPDEWEQLMQP